jgi:[acyl-carrier-protein] S-malonyltransferase
MKTAFVFPGQGPQEVAMFAAVEDRRSFREKYELLCDVLGRDPKTEDIHQNEIASTATVLCSALELERLRELGIECSAAAGYSVGQFTAMYAAGMLSFEETLRLVFERAKLMNASPATQDGAMLAVIGLPTEKVQAIVDAIQPQDFVAISNFNCLGQLTLAGTKRGIARAREALEAEKPRKLAPVGTSGAWHCRLLHAAAEQFAALLAKVSFAAPAFPIADNVTGDFLPAERGALLSTLSLHLSSPVRWEACVKTLDAERYVEVGYGDMLTKFGFFIDRKKQHLPSKNVT